MEATFDHHMHLGYGNFRKQGRSDKYRGTELDNAYNNLLEYGDTAITRLRDGGDKQMVAFRLKDEAAAIGIELQTAGRALVKRGHYGKHLGFPVSTMDELRRELEFLAAQGVDWFKLVQSGLVDVTGAPQDETPSFNEEELRLIREFADACHIPVMVHVNFPAAIESVIDAGMDTIEHGYFMTEPLLLKMKAKNIVWTPTVAPFDNALTYDRWISGWQPEVVAAVAAQQKAMVVRAAALGVRLWAGSDAGSSIVPHGRGTADEHRILSALVGDEYQ